MLKIVLYPGRERNILMEDVYPYVRDYARKMGVDFNSSDMQWGVKSE